MKNILKRFWHEEEGMGTVEIVIIIAVLVAIALIFRKAIVDFATNLMKNLFSQENANKAKETIAPIPTVK